MRRCNIFSVATYYSAPKTSLADYRQVAGIDSAGPEKAYAANVRALHEDPENADARRLEAALTQLSKKKFTNN